MKRLRWIVGIMFIVLSLTASSQTDSDVGEPDAMLWWIEAGFGLSSYPGEAFSAGLGADVAMENALYSVKLIHSEQIQICIWGPCDKPSRYVTEINALYGRIHRGNYGYVSASAGLGLVLGQYDSDEYATIGLPLEIRGYITPLSFFGLGATLFANINAHKVHAGFHVGLEIGRLRP